MSGVHLVFMGNKMRGGTPLTDEDRRPWLRAVAAWTRARAAEGRSTAVTCFVHLSGSRELVARLSR